MHCLSRPSLLMLLALLIGQWLGVAHAQRHADPDSHPAQDVESVCVYCLHASGLDAALPASAASRVAWVAGVVIGETPLARATMAAGNTAPPIRGPPHILV